MKNNIRHFRELRGVSQKELAELVGTSQPQIYRLEKGERRFSDYWMQKIAAHLDCTPSDLISDPALPSKEPRPQTPPPKELTFFKLSDDFVFEVTNTARRALQEIDGRHPSEEMVREAVAYLKHFAEHQRTNFLNPSLAVGLIQKMRAEKEGLG
jgi:transcriptional regulator with XRE-family HTH domain